MQADRYLVWATNQLGWGSWDELQSAVQREPLFRFDFFLKSRTALELRRRVEVLARQLEKELAKPLEKERKKRKKQAEATAQKRRDKYAKQQKGGASKRSRNR
eukprot:SAG22_NODE_119_length_19257_cov_43.260413_2_plen_103_part_00